MRICGFWLCLATWGASVQPAPAETTAAQIVGEWKLVSLILEKDKTLDEPYGPHPSGLVIFTPDGRFSLQLLRPDLPIIASGNRLKPTAEESEAVARGVLSYFGGWKVLNPALGEFQLHVEASSFANWNNTDQPRFISVTGDIMTLKVPASPSGGISTLTLKRAE